MHIAALACHWHDYNLLYKCTSIISYVHQNMKGACMHDVHAAYVYDSVNSGHGVHSVNVATVVACMCACIYT